MTKISSLFRLRNINFLLGFIFLVSVFLLVFGPLNPATISSISVDTSQPIYSGQMLTYTTNVCRNVGADVRTDILRSLVGADLDNADLTPITLQTDNTASPKGCTSRTRTTLIPFATPSGCYRLDIKAIYVVIPIRPSVLREQQSNRFCIAQLTADQQMQTLQQEINNLQTQRLNDLQGLSSVQNVDTHAKQGNSNAPTPSSPAPSPTPTPQQDNGGSVDGVISTILNNAGNLLKQL